MRKGPVYLSVTSSADLKALDATNKKLRDLGKTAKSSAPGFGSLGKSLAKLGSVAAITSLGFKALKEAQEAFQVSAMTEQLLKNTGLAASVTGKQIGDLSMQISNLTGVDDEQVQAASNVLLGFKGLIPAGSNAYSTLANLTQVSTDLAAKMGKEPVAAAKLLGKALADPARGVTALYRAGIPLDKQLEARVKALAKAGQVEQARALLLQNVAGQTKGLAAAVADPMTRLQTMFNNLLETIGTPILDALTPILASLQPLMVSLTPVLNQVGVLVAMVVTALANGLAPVIPVLTKMLLDLTPSFAQVAMVIGAMLPLVVALVPMLVGLANIFGKHLPDGLKAVIPLLRGTVIALQQYLNLMSSITSLIGGPLHEAFKTSAAAATDVVNALQDIKNTDFTAVTAQALKMTALDYKGAAVALNVGAKNAASAAKAVGSATGKKTAKVKPKTAVTPRTKTAANQSFTVAGTGGGISMSVTINGSVVQERDVARTIRDELMQFARRQGVTPVFGV